MEKFYADSSFLEIQGDLNDPHVIWGNVKTYLPAFERMKRYLYVENNRLRWDVVSGAELNISENIYDYVVRCWEGMNRQLEESGGTLELYNGYYRIAYENVDDKQRKRNISRGDSDPVLIYGDHPYNMLVLFEIVWEVYEYHIYNNLKDFLDLPSCLFEGDAIGGMRVTGWLYAPGGYCRYYCCNACASMQGERRFACEFNDIIGWDREVAGDDWFFKVLNISGLPLITLYNPENYEEERGLILKHGHEY